MGEAIRIPLHSQRKSLLGYWYLRQQGERYRVTFRYPGQKHKRYETDDPEQAVCLLYDAYVGFLGKKLSELEEHEKSLPKREPRRPGFRPGWLKKARAAIVNDRKSLVKEARKVLASKLLKMREAGWPQPPLPQLPWDDVDGKQAARNIWLGGGGGAVVPRGGKTAQHRLPTVRPDLSEGPQGPAGSWGSNPRPRNLFHAGGGSPIFQTLSGGSSSPGSRDFGGQTTFQAIAGLRPITRTGTPDSTVAGGTDRPGDPTGSTPQEGTDPPATGGTPPGAAGEAAV